jgi:hypothetical protein
MPEDEGEEHVDAEMADATDGLAVSAKKKKNKKKKKGGGGGGGDGGAEAEGAEEAGAEEAGTASAAAGDGADRADADGADGEGGGEMSAAKKKREKKKAAEARKKAAAAAEGGGAEGGAPDEAGYGTPWSTEIRGIKPWGPYPKCEKGGKQQTAACTVPVLEQFPSGHAPVGEEVATSPISPVSLPYISCLSERRWRTSTRRSPLPEPEPWPTPSPGRRATRTLARAFAPTLSLTTTPPLAPTVRWRTSTTRTARGHASSRRSCARLSGCTRSRTTRLLGLGYG